MKLLKDLPISSITVPPDALGKDIDNHFKSDPQLSGAIVMDGDQLVGVISRNGFYNQMSRRTGFDIFANRPVTIILEHVSSSTMTADPSISVNEAVDTCLSRQTHMIYEPLLLNMSDGSYALISFNELILAQSQVLENTMEEIAEKSRQVQDSIRYAERIQNSMIFNTDKEVPNWFNYFVIYRPRDIVSGDFYWVSEANDRLYIAVADCTGHGVPGAFMSLIGHGHISSLVVNEGITDPSDILTELHVRVRQSLHQERVKDVAYDGMEVGLCVVDKAANQISFAGAKRPMIICDPQGHIETHKGDRNPIGGKQKERRRKFTTLNFTLQKEATYYLYSDGFTDQCDPINRKFGTKRLREAFSHIAPIDLKQKHEFLVKTLDLFQKNEPQRDDIALMGFTFDLD